MLRNSSKAFKTAVKEYYNSIVRSEEEQEELAAAFWSYYNTHKDRELNHIKAFENFVNSCSTNFDFETFKQRELLKSWYRETEKQSEKHSGDRVSEIFCDIISREFERRSIKY